MATLTIKKMPDARYARLKEQAERHRRSINNEAIVCLETILAPPFRDPEEAIREAEELNREFPFPFSSEIIEEGKRVGRA